MLGDLGGEFDLRRSANQFVGRRLKESRINSRFLLGSYGVLASAINHIINNEPSALSLLRGGVCEARTRHLSYAIAALYQMS